MRRLRILGFLLVWLMGAFSPALIEFTRAQDEQAVYFAEIRGVIGPPAANYLLRVLEEAEASDARLVVVEMDTPGGLDTAMREMIQAMLASPVPVAVYVSPSGARAASAGLFILTASHIAAMAPGTNTGAAHPVALGGEGEDDTAITKAEHDAAALIRSLAVGRQRNADWAERAVRESVSVTAEEALELNVIDLIAASRDDLLQQIDGQTIQTAAGEIILETASAPRREAAMTFAEQLLHVIANPNIAFLLLSIGSIGLIAELYNPGTLIPGITGIISLLLAFFALGSLPTNWAGVGFIVFAVILLVAELHTETSGVLAVGGLVAFLLGALILFRPFVPGSPALPDLSVSPWLLGLTMAAIASFIFLIIGQVLRTREAPLLTGSEQYAGQFAQVRQDLRPLGRVWFQGQFWAARTQSGQEVAAGQAVRIVGLDGLTLIVEPTDSASESNNSG
jgi:membrane-bound serine protease (ClpP class)